MERKAKFRSEYVNGVIYPHGTSPPPIPSCPIQHDRINRNLYHSLDKALSGSSCEYFTHNMSVGTKNSGFALNPDAFALCDEIQLSNEKSDTITNPSFIAEILSNTSELDDLGDKFDAYATIPSLQEYLLIAQTKMSVEFRKREDNHWFLQYFTSPDDSIEIPSLEISIRLGDLYEKVEFE